MNLRFLRLAFFTGSNRLPVAAGFPKWPVGIGVIGEWEADHLWWRFYWVRKENYL